MRKEITKEEWAETNRKVQEMFHQIEADALQKMPLWMRLNFFSNKLCKAMKDGHTDDDINWNYINEMCTKGLSEFDYNRYKSVSTVEEFEEQRFDVICASEGIAPWHKHKCKDCGKEFYMSYKEVHFYEERGLNLPKRCKECREKRKNNQAK